MRSGPLGGGPSRRGASRPLSLRCVDEEDITIDDVYEALLFIEVSVLDQIDDDGRRLTVHALRALVGQEHDWNDALCLRAHGILLNGVSNPILSATGTVLMDMIASHGGCATRDHALPAFDKLIALLSVGDTEAAKDHWTCYLDEFITRRQ